MTRYLASFLFYARFLNSFSALGFRRRAKRWASSEFDFSGQRWVVTGASGGIGRAIVSGALEHGAEVIAVARSEQKLTRLKSRAPNSDALEIVTCDLADVQATQALAQHAPFKAGKIDVLVNNVGVLLNDFEQTREGIEASLASNLIGHFALTEALIKSPGLKPNAIVVEVSSGGMYGVPLGIDAMFDWSDQTWDGMHAYALHKRAQVALVRAWNQRWTRGRGAYVMHPGWVDTAGLRTSLPAFRAALKRVLRTPEQGADTILWLAHARPEVSDSGGIWLDRQLESEHAFGFTRRSDDSAEGLYQRLQDVVGQTVEVNYSG